MQQLLELWGFFDNGIATDNNLNKAKFDFWKYLQGSTTRWATKFLYSHASKAWGTLLIAYDFARRVGPMGVGVGA